MSRRLAADAVSEHIDLPDLQMGKEPDDVGGQVGVFRELLCLRT